MTYNVFSGTLNPTQSTQSTLIQTKEAYDDLVDGGVAGEDALGARLQLSERRADAVGGRRAASTSPSVEHLSSCLLYTSDAADE